MNAERRDEQVPEPDDPVAELSYMAASRELDEIVNFFERSDVDIDQLVARLERATAIVDELDRRIRRTRAQVEELVPRLEAVGRTPTSEPTPAQDDETAQAEGGDVDDRSALVRGEEGEPEGDKLPF
jgi:exodeoxyribonuclease VII small subunit